MFPYKTKFETDFQVDWGRTYPKSTPEARQKKELQLFDIREFVKAKKQEKMAAMGEFNPTSSSPFGGNPFGGGNPFAGSNPFGGGNPFAGSNPFGGGMPSFLENEPSKETSDDSFNIDDLVKKIDAKIAEIEKEEEQSKEQEVKEEPIEVTSEPVVPEGKESVSFNDIVATSKDNVPKEDKLQNMYTDNTDDDDFFDDFFSDD